MKSIAASALAQVPRLIPLLLLIYIPILLGLVTLVVIYLVADIPLRMFFIDPVAEFNSPIYIGSVSNVGVLLWGAAASVCLFGGWLTFNSQESNQEVAWFLVCSGLISTMLMFDDLYLLHGNVLEDDFGISKEFVFATYGCLVLALLFRFRKLVIGTDFLLLMLAFTFFAISIGVDILVEPEEFFIFGNLPGRHIIEDGAKLFGVATWSVYFVRTSVQKVTPLIRCT